MYSDKLIILLPWFPPLPFTLFKEKKQSAGICLGQRKKEEQRGRDHWEFHPNG
jgi:hypothetical protein